MKARLVVSAGVLALLVLAMPQKQAVAAGHGEPDALLRCLESIARTFHVRIVDASGRAIATTCVPLQRSLTLEQAMDRQLQTSGLAWRRLDDGTLEVVAANASSSLKLPALDIEGEPLTDTQPRGNAMATALIEHATASTTLDTRWLETAPLLGFNQISQYAPNLYGSGQSLAIRGTERSDDAFPALSVTYDGIDLGTRLLDDDLVPLDDVTNLDIARGPRSFVSTGEAQAGVIALKTAEPAGDPIASIMLGAGNPGVRDGAASWSGPLWTPGLNATMAFDSHQSLGLINQLAVPAANVEKHTNDFAHFKLSYAPESPAGLSAQLSALAVSGDSSDRDAVPPVPTAGERAPAFDPFSRNSYAAFPVLAQTRARGGAGFVRYENPAGMIFDAHASITTIFRDATQLPDDKHWTDRELWRRLGVTASAHPAPDWTIVSGLEHSAVTTAYYSPEPPLGPVLIYYVTSTDSASLWLEHSWSGCWNAGFGMRWVHEGKSSEPLSDEARAFTVPIPLAVLEWRPLSGQAFSLSFGTGYRNGGPGGFEAATPLVPERSENFEFAWRGQWLDGAVHTTLSAFAGEIRNRFTYFSLDSSGNPLLGRVRDRGLEFEVDADVSDYWRVRAGVGALSSRYSSFAYRYADPTSEAPPQTATLGVRYGLTHGWYGAADAYHAAGAQYEFTSIPVMRVPAYDIVSVRTGYRSKRWEAALIATNTLDAHYIERIQMNQPNPFGYRLGDPRRIELRLKWTW